jgi:PadR family transcriptional regulator, regulatory protein PadR
VSREELSASQGSLYPALHRLEVKGYLKSAMVPSENNRRARVYTITAAGRRHLTAESNTWTQFVASMGRILEGA